MIINEIVASAKEYGARRVILFGSAVEDIEKARDIDIACDGIDGWAFYEFGALLENKLSRSLDIVSLTPTTPFTRHIETYGRVLL